MSKAVLCVYTEIQLVLALLYYRKKLAPQGIEPCFVLFKTSLARFSTIDTAQLPGIVHVYRNDLNESVLWPDKSFLELLSLEDVSHISYPNSPFLTHEVVANAFASRRAVSRILVSDGASFGNRAPLKSRVKFSVHLLVRRFLNRVPYLSGGLFRDTCNLGNADVVIAHESTGVAGIEFVLTDDLLCSEGALESIMALFGDSLALLDTFRACRMVFFGQPRLAGGIREEEYRRALEHLARFAREHDAPLVIKPHPAEDARVYGKLLDEHVSLVDSKVPAEVLLAQLQHIVVLSFFSSVSLGKHDETQRHVWLKGMMANQVQVRDNPGIITVSSQEELNQALTDPLP